MWLFTSRLNNTVVNLNKYNYTLIVYFFAPKLDNNTLVFYNRCVSILIKITLRFKSRIENIFYSILDK